MTHGVFGMDELVCPVLTYHTVFNPRVKAQIFSLAVEMLRLYRRTSAYDAARAVGRWLSDPSSIIYRPPC